MNRQDRNMVRSAQELERKYRLAEIQKAIELKENVLTRTDQILRDFVNIVVGTLDNFEGLIDGHITTYFGSGVPSLDTEPTVSWEDIWADHVNDLYYDKENGKAYTFTLSEGVFSWVEVIDEDKVKVLAMANATTDAKDGFRRIFVEEPTTPYDNGDLWLKDGVIYICQISKPSTESFESNDFIISSQYSGDTLAIKIGTELEVLKGTVLKIIEDADFVRVELNDLDKETQSSIELIKNALSTLITDENGQSMMKQTTDGWVFEMKNIIETLNTATDKVTDLESEVSETSSNLSSVESAIKGLEQKTTYVTVGTYNGEPCIELGSKESDFKVVITNTNILFMEGSDIPAHISNQTLNINKAFVETEIQIGTMAWVKRANGHISFLPKGVVEDVSTKRYKMG